MNEIRRGYMPPPRVERRTPASTPEQRLSPEATLETREARIENVASQMADIAREYGVDALREMLAKMQSAVEEGRGVQAQELIEVIETTPERSQFQEAALSKLQQLGLIERRKGMIIVDDQRLLAEFSLDAVKKYPGPSLDEFERFTSSRLEFLGNAFAGKSVILKKEYKHDPDNAEAKPLFYLPETREEALDIEKIRSADFHYGLWEVAQITKTVGGPSAVEVEQPASITDQRYLETSLAAIIYHPKYGNGRRDEHDKLLINVEGKEHAVTGQWLYDQGLKFSLDGRPNIIKSAPAEVLNKYAANIVELGLLKPDDIAKVRSTNRAQEAARISSNGFVSIGGVKHYLGRQYNNRSIRIDAIGNGLAALVELDDHGVGTPVGIINAFEKGDTQLAERKTNTGSFFEAGGKLTQPRAFSETEFQTPKPGENPDVFFERKQQFDNFQTMLRFDNALKQETDVAIFDLSPALREELRAHAQNIQKHEELYLQTTRVFGKEGLEIIAALVENAPISEKVLKSALELPFVERNVLLPTLRDAVLARRQALKELERRKHNGEVTDLEYRKLVFEMNRRITSLVTAAEDSAAIHESMDAPGKDEALEKLSKQGNELVLFSSIFRDAFKGTQEMDFEEMRGLSIETANGGQLDEETMSQMLTIFETNWRGQKPELLSALRHGFVSKLKPGTEQRFYKKKGVEKGTIGKMDLGMNTQFHILKKDGRVVAFIRFDDRPDLEPGALYGGSLNVDPSLRGSAIGEAMMKAAVDQAAKDHVIHADVFPDLVVGTKYVEDLGCVITGVEEVKLSDDGKTAKRLLLRRDDQENQTYSRSEKRGQSFTVDLRKGIETLTKLIEDRSRRGEVATRYFADPQNPNLRTLVFEPRARVENETALAAK